MLSSTTVLNIDNHKKFLSIKSVYYNEFCAVEYIIELE